MSDICNADWGVEHDDHLRWGQHGTADRAGTESLDHEVAKETKVAKHEAREDLSLRRLFSTPSCFMFFAVFETSWSKARPSRMRAIQRRRDRRVYLPHLPERHFAEIRQQADAEVTVAQVQ